MSESDRMSVTTSLSDCLNIVWVDPVSAQACAKAVKLALSVDSIVLITLFEFTTSAKFTAASYERVL